MPYTNLIPSGAYYGIRSVDAPGVCLHETPDYLGETALSRHLPI